MCPDEVGADGASGKVFITMCKTKRQGRTIIHIHSLRFRSFGGFCERFLKQTKRTLEIKQEISESAETYHSNDQLCTGSFLLGTSLQGMSVPTIMAIAARRRGLAALTLDIIGNVVLRIYVFFG